VTPRADESGEKSVMRMEATSRNPLKQGCGCALMSKRKEDGLEYGGESEGGTGEASLVDRYKQGGWGERRGRQHQCRLTVSWQD
jgi:hypothetical protein